MLTVGSIIQFSSHILLIVVSLESLFYSRYNVESPHKLIAAPHRFAQRLKPAPRGTAAFSCKLPFIEDIAIAISSLVLLRYTHDLGHDRFFYS